MTTDIVEGIACEMIGLNKPKTDKVENAAAHSLDLVGAEIPVWMKFLLSYHKVRSVNENSSCEGSNK